MQATRSPDAFTLIELLVVITIIVVLLALLAPAIDRAVYRAELAVCAARLNATGETVLTYAMENKRHYPGRVGLDDPPSPRRVSDIKTDSGDDRPGMKSYMPALNAMFQCPLTGKADLEGSLDSSYVIGSYVRWYGFQYATTSGLGSGFVGTASPTTKVAANGGMRRMGDALGWTDAFGPHSFRVLAGDLYVVNNWVQSAHPDKDGALFDRVVQDGPLNDDASAAGVASALQYYTFSCWNRGNQPVRGAIDRNLVMDDRSVLQIDNEKVNDVRVYPVPERSNAASFPQMTTWLPETH